MKESERIFRWCDTSDVPENTLVWTAIIDSEGIRNVQKLRHKKNFWFDSDGIYVYYSPTHWSV